MYVGGPGHYNTHLLANGGSYLSQPVPPFTWNLAEIRRAPLLAARSLAAMKTGSPSSLGSAEWNTIPAEKLGPLSLGSPAPQWMTEIKVAYDPTALYVRFEGQLPAQWTGPPSMQRDHEEIPSCESFHALVAPDNNAARYHRFAGGPIDGARYDARRGFVEDSIDPRFNQDDVAWDPEWRYECALAADAKSWSGLMVIPFPSLRAMVPAAGTEWKVNFARVHQVRRYMPREISLWSSNPGTPSLDDPQAFGALVFE
jgi:hypothetical protein